MKYYIPLLILTFFISCKKENKQKEAAQIVIDLELQKNNGEFINTLSPFAHVKKELYKDFKGVPKLDSISIQMHRTYSLRDLKKKLADNVIDSTTFKNFIYGVYAVTGFENGKQFLIVDVNNNKDFSDDIKQVFSNKLRESTTDYKTRDSVFKVFKIKTNTYYEGEIIEKHSYIKPFPYKDYYTFKNPTKEIIRENNFQLASQYNQHYSGEFQNNYKVAVQIFNKRTKMLFAKKGETFKPKTKGVYYTKYAVNDTVKLETASFKIDSLDQIKNKLFLSKIDDSSIQFGYRPNDKIKDFGFYDVKKNRNKISTILKNKEYILLDFWGTWCEPCKKLTPDLLEMNAKIPSVQIIGIAYDFNEKYVDEYIQNNNLNWVNIFEKRVSRDSLLHKKIVGQLNVINYPTFFLINKKRRIVYRGYGKSSLDSIKKILNFKSTIVNSNS